MQPCTRCQRSKKIYRYSVTVSVHAPYPVHTASSASSVAVDINSVVVMQRTQHALTPVVTAMLGISIMSAEKMPRLG